MPVSNWNTAPVSREDTVVDMRKTNAVTCAFHSVHRFSSSEPPTELTSWLSRPSSVHKKLSSEQRSKSQGTVTSVPSSSRYVFQSAGSQDTSLARSSKDSSANVLSRTLGRTVEIRNL